MDMQEITGLVGIKAIVAFAGRFYSPVYGHCQWERGLQTASCDINCGQVPSTVHQGCGFHAHWLLDESKRFVEQIRGTADCLVLLECFGRIAVHERGFRAEKAKVVAVIDWDPRYAFFTYPLVTAFTQPSVPEMAVKYFGVPLINDRQAADLVEASRVRLAPMLYGWTEA